MRAFAGWAGTIFAIILGVVAVLAAGWLFAPVAPSLALLIAVPLLAGAALTAGASWLIARRLRWSSGRTASIAVAVMLAPFLALAGWISVSPTPTLAAPSPDPRGQPEMLTLATGSKLATWTVPGENTRRRTPVIFLHGGPGLYIKARDFGLGAGFRKAGFDTIYFDQAGSGASADLAVKDYTLARQVADLDALRITLGAEKIIVWGESWGATLGAAYALAHPDRVAGAVFSSPGEYPGMGEAAFDYSNVMPAPEVDRPPSAMVLYGLLTVAPQLAEEWMDQATSRKVNGAIQVQDLKGPGPRCKGSKWDGKPRPRTSESSIYVLRRVLLDSFAQPAPGPHSFDIPTLIVRGDCDFSPASVAQLYGQAYPKARLVAVPGAGHALLDHEAAFVTDSTLFADKDLAGVP